MRQRPRRQHRLSVAWDHRSEIESGGVLIMSELESRVNALERQQSNFDTKFEMYMQRMDRQMERLDRQMERLESRQNQFEEKYEADKRELRQEFRGMYQKLDEIGRHTQNLTLTAMASMGAIAVAVVGFIWSLATR